MLVLGIESSCDETGIGLYDTNYGLLSHALHSQVLLHEKHGGVVPELASRDHIKYLIPLVDEVLLKTKLSLSDVDAIAYTAGPGLIGALLTGACFAKSLSFSLNIPAIKIHHLEAHLLAPLMENAQIQFPFVTLLVSGGHTQLIEAHGLNQYALLGDTLDDAVGEAFDKTAKLMGINYPGGAKLAKLADEYQNPVTNIKFPRPMTDRPGLDFSFSGLKTCALHHWLKSKHDLTAKREIAYAFQDAVVDTLVIKCKRALLLTKHKTLIVAGGVGANLRLRKALKTMIKDLGGEVYFPSIEFCTDNGAMVAFAGALYLNGGHVDHGLTIDIKPRWPIS